MHASTGAVKYFHFRLLLLKTMFLGHTQKKQVTQATTQEIDNKENDTQPQVDRKM